MPRTKSAFTPKQFSDAMDPLVAARGKSFCTYSDESDQVAKAVLDKPSVQRNYDVLVALRDLTNNLVLKKSTILAGLVLSDQDPPFCDQSPLSLIRAPLSLIRPPCL